MSNVEFILAQRGGAHVSVNNFLFKRKSAPFGSTEYYYCISKNCKSSLQVKDNEVLINSINENHSHPDHQDQIQRLKIERNIRKRAAEEPFTSVLAIYR